VSTLTDKFRIYGFADEKILMKFGLDRYYHGQAWGIEMFKILYRSKISLNRHIKMAGDFAANLRLFESTGMGSYLLTDYKPNLNLLFPIQSISTYRNFDDIRRLINLAENNSSEIIDRSAKAQKHTLEFHNYKIRAKSMIRNLSLIGNTVG
jgi:spore maturation protein CgeB